MASHVKKIQKMYEEYMRENLTQMDKQEVIQHFVETVLGITDLSNPEVYKQIVGILLNYERRKSKLAAQDMEELDTLEPEELDLSNMHQPNDFGDLLHSLKLMSTDSDLSMRDISNAISLAKQIKPYMFDVEVPRVGTIEGVLCFTWGLDEEKMVIISFIEGTTIVEMSGKDDSVELNVEDGLSPEELTTMARMADYVR